MCHQLINHKVYLTPSRVCMKKLASSESWSMKLKKRVVATCLFFSCCIVRDVQWTASLAHFCLVASLSACIKLFLDCWMSTLRKARRFGKHSIYHGGWPCSHGWWSGCPPSFLPSFLPCLLLLCLLSCFLSFKHRCWCTSRAFCHFKTSTASRALWGWRNRLYNSTSRLIPLTGPFNALMVVQFKLFINLRSCGLLKKRRC